MGNTMAMPKIPGNIQDNVSTHLKKYITKDN